MTDLRKLAHLVLLALLYRMLPLDLGDSTSLLLC